MKGFTPKTTGPSVVFVTYFLILLARPGQALIPEAQFGVVPEAQNTSAILNGPPPSENFPFQEQLTDDYTLYWDFNDTHITFEMVVRTTGWVGFGISSTGGMAGSDVIIGWVKDNQTFFADRHGEGNFLPAKDSSQDWTLLMGQESGEYTVLKVVRPLDTCDDEDVAIQHGTSRVIYAYYATDPPSEDAISYHGSTRGVKSLLLLEPPTYHNRDENTLPSDVIVLEFRNRNFSVPSDDTTYRCTLWKLPELHGKHHMIRFEPILQAGNENLPHHILLYYCGGGDLNATSSVTPDAYNCYETRPQHTSECFHVLLGWAIGGKRVDYPSHVGYPFGGENDPKYFLMETHYDNPNRRSDYVDDSGLRLYLTRQLRQYDAGVLEVGLDVTPLHMLPPGQKQFLSRAYCEESCLAKGMGDQEPEIHIVADLLHMHLIGTKMVTRHIRNGTELPPIMEDNNYIFDFQESRFLKHERTVKKGDSLVVDCVYDTSGRTHLTFGGLSTRQEMCFSFLLYYPRVPLTICQSGIVYKLPEDFQGSNVFDLVRHWDWTDPKSTERFKAIIADSQFYQECSADNGDMRADIQIINQPNITELYIRPSVCSPKDAGVVFP